MDNEASSQIQSGLSRHIESGRCCRASFGLTQSIDSIPAVINFLGVTSSVVSHRSRRAVASQRLIPQSKIQIIQNIQQPLPFSIAGVSQGLLRISIIHLSGIQSDSGFR